MIEWNRQGIDWQGLPTDDQFMDDLREYVTLAVSGLPWYFAVPMKVQAHLIWAGIALLTAQRPNQLEAAALNGALRRVRRFVPLFDILNKFVRAMLFLRMFDAVVVAESMPTASAGRHPVRAAS
jgi:hypothetical protein